MTLLWITVVVVLFGPRWLRIRQGSRKEIHGLLRWLWWLDRFYCGFWHRLELPVGNAPLPFRGAALLVSNHTSGVDSMLLQAGCERCLGFLIAKDWYDHWLVHPMCKLLGCIPVRRDGRDLAATRAALRALAEGRVVPIFPEGVILPTSGRELGEGKPGAAFIALQSDVPVVPAYILGAPPTDDIFRSWLSPSHSRIIFGKPLDFSRFRSHSARISKEAVAEANDFLMAAIRALKDGSEHPNGQE